MARPAVAGGVQHADIDPAGQRAEVAQRVVLGNGAVREAAAVQGDFQALDPERPGAAGRELRNAIGEEMVLVAALSAS